MLKRYCKSSAAVRGASELLSCTGGRQAIFAALQTAVAAEAGMPTGGIHVPIGEPEHAAGHQKELTM